MSLSEETGLERSLKYLKSIAYIRKPEEIKKNTYKEVTDRNSDCFTEYVLFTHVHYTSKYYSPDIKNKIENAGGGQ